MPLPSQPDNEFERQPTAPLLDVLIRASLILAMAVLCYQIFSPFLTLMVWALILAITLYPLHQFLAGRMGGRQGLAATLLVVAGLALIVAPTGTVLPGRQELPSAVLSSVKDVTGGAATAAGAAMTRYPPARAAADPRTARRSRWARDTGMRTPLSTAPERSPLGAGRHETTPAAGLSAPVWSAHRAWRVLGPPGQ